MENGIIKISDIEKIMSEVNDEQDLLDLHIHGYRELDLGESILAGKMAQALVRTSYDEKQIRSVLIDGNGSCLVYAPQGIGDRTRDEEGIYLYKSDEDVFLPIITEEEYLWREDFQEPADVELGSVELSDYR